MLDTLWIVDSINPKSIGGWGEVNRRLIIDVHLQCLTVHGVHGYTVGFCSVE
jgi:hypothetical protein